MTLSDSDTFDAGIKKIIMSLFSIVHQSRLVLGSIVSTEAIYDHHIE
ncbi:hypothetical protein [Candidatus Nitrospira salsa]